MRSHAGPPLALGALSHVAHSLASFKALCKCRLSRKDFHDQPIPSSEIQKFTASLSPLDCSFKKAHAVATAVSPVPRTMPGTLQALNKHLFTKWINDVPSSELGKSRVKAFLKNQVSCRPMVLN